MSDSHNSSKSEPSQNYLEGKTKFKDKIITQTFCCKHPPQPTDFLVQLFTYLICCSCLHLYRGECEKLDCIEVDSRKVTKKMFLRYL